MNIDTLLYLASEKGVKLISEAKSIDGTFLRKATILRKKYPVDIVNSALEQIELRKRASKKFTLAEKMFFTKESLEQASGEVISDYHAERYPTHSDVLDLACGIGGDTISLAKTTYVTAVDLDLLRIEMARINIDAYGLSNKVKFVHADVNDFPLVADYAFLDPSRRINGKRTQSMKEMNPPIAFINKLRSAIPSFGVKLSPASDDNELASLETGIEFISESGECKEAIAWFGDFDPKGVGAVILPQRAIIKKSMSLMSETVNNPGKYLYEPDPAVIRSHTVNDICKLINAWYVDPINPYISSNDLIDTPFANAFTIIDKFPFNIKHLNEYIRKNNIGKVVIKKRLIPFEPEEIMKKLKLSGKYESIFIITRIFDKNWIFICERA